MKLVVCCECARHLYRTEFVGEVCTKCARVLDYDGPSVPFPYDPPVPLTWQPPAGLHAMAVALALKGT